MKLVLGELFSLLSSLCLAYSTFGKDKQRMLLWQTVNAGFYSVSCLFLGGYAAVASNLLTIIRNVLQLKKKMTRKLAAVLCVFIVVLGTLCNNRGLLGFLPVTASVIYTIMLYAARSPRQMHLAVIVNMLQWAAFDCVIRAYPSLGMDIVIISLSVLNLCRRSTTAQESHRTS